jgi:S1-C subfamily serine protease
MLTCTKCKSEFYISARAGGITSHPPDSNDEPSGSIPLADEAPVQRKLLRPYAVPKPAGADRGSRPSTLATTWPLVILGVLSILVIVVALKVAGDPQAVTDGGTAPKTDETRNTRSSSDKDRSRVVTAPPAMVTNERPPVARSGGKAVSVPAARPGMKPPIDPAAKVRNAVALVENGIRSGTGFMIAENTFVTSARVVEASFVDELKLVFETLADQHYRVVQVLYFDPLRDICLLRIDGKQPCVALDTTDVSPGNAVFLLGNPPLRGNTIERNILKPGNVVAHVRHENRSYYQITVPGATRSSGEPVVTQSGDVVGVLSLAVSDLAVETIGNFVSKLKNQMSVGGAVGFGANPGFGNYLQPQIKAEFGPLNWFADELRQGPSKVQLLATPAAEIAKALSAIAQREEVVAAAHGEVYFAHVLFRRAAYVAGINLLLPCASTEISFRRSVVEERDRINDARSRLSKAKANVRERRQRELNDEVDRLLPLVPEELADAAGTDLRRIHRLYNAEFATKFTQVQRSRHLPDPLKESFARFAQTFDKAEGFSRKPPLRYEQFSREFRVLDEELRKVTRPLAALLKETTAATSGGW